jgi:hypothetical protein
MSNRTIDKYLLKLQEVTNQSEVSHVDMYKIGEEIGLVDKIQTEHIVEILLKDGLVNNKENFKIELSEEGHRRLKIKQI